MLSINKRLDMIRGKIIDPKFLDGSGLGNEINFRIFDYDPKDEMIVREHIRRLIKDFSTASSPMKIIEFDLYKMLIEMTKEEGLFEELFDFELVEGKDELFSALKDFSKPKYFIDKIKEDSASYNIIFITGVGKVFPFLRSHSVLNNLHEAIEEKPVIMFYPGIYNAQDLGLFGKIKDDNYYRAFPLVDRKLEV